MEVSYKISNIAFKLKFILKLQFVDVYYQKFIFIFKNNPYNLIAIYLHNFYTQVLKSSFRSLKKYESNL
jgi:hypothetical protein